MTLLAGIGVAVLVGGGLYLLLSRSFQRVVLGFLMLSNGVNLLVLASTRLPDSASAPVVGAGAGPPADPLPQAFLLTAIVIGLGAAVFLLAIAARAFGESGGDETGED